MNQFQDYFVEEFVQAYKDGLMSRRDMMRRVLHITGGIASTASLLTLMGCGSTSAPAGSAAASSAAPLSPAASPSNAAVSAKPAASAAGSTSAAAKPASAPASASAKPAASGSAAAKPATSGSAAASAAPAAKSPISVPANDPAIAGKDVSFQGNGATLLVYEARPANASGALPVILVCEQNRGLDEHIRDVTRRFAKEGYLAVALDMVSRDGGTAKQDPAKIPALLSEPSHVANQVGDWKAVVDYYSKQPGVKPEALGMNGFCYGGSVTYEVATKLPTLKAAVPFYGSTPGVDAAKNIKAAVFGVYSSDPNDGANRGRDDLDTALKAANVIHQFKVYPDTRHAFNDDTGRAYNQVQALAAWKDTLDWFAKYVKG
jgi:carboxymethylenebutenolidase